ncbi:MAG: hypothetical protein KGJ86_18425 [Chloroflexota bacterium]|nr:hypothetical protein [Chloroflexota bacterium]
MNVLDESFLQDQRRLLAGWRIRVRQVGVELGRSGMKDDEIIPLLHQLRRPTFFSRDRDFYKPALRHPGYCLIWLEVIPSETASLRAASSDTPLLTLRQ